MFDTQSYDAKKTRGLASLAKIGDSYAVYSKRFNADTGEEINADIVAVDLNELEAKKIELQEQIASIDAFINEAEAL